MNITLSKSVNESLECGWTWSFSLKSLKMAIAVNSSLPASHTHAWILFSLVTLTSRFEATRGLFWDGHRDVEPQLDDEKDTWTWLLFSLQVSAPAGERLTRDSDLTSPGQHLSWHHLSKLLHRTNGRTFGPPTCDLTFNRPIHDGSSVISGNPSAPKPRPYYSRPTHSWNYQIFEHQFA
ncbi:hypothetical protein AVEN_177044-1 [Araneus ventricosus]|uniref:Uncharacterized protein n=1 Tax=Araneus ventricosus TaxID=182803 RepID=A0A4Y2CRM4_ARAVE|nr:hypothetical protein AVEN_177044-1 [Araneus ventricosus]